MNGQEQIRHSVLAMPSKASPLVKQLVPRIMRASCEGIGSGDDSEYEDRAFSAFLVCISHLANMKDAKKRDGIIADLSGYADAVVAQSVESMDQIAEMVGDEHVEEAMETAIKAGVGEVVPNDEPSTH